MEQILKDIQSLFIKFQFLECYIRSELDTLKIIEPNFDEIDNKYDFETTKIKRQLQLIYLLGNDTALNRIKEELFKIEQLLKPINFGFNISYDKKTKAKYQKKGKNLIIEPEIVVKICSIKLNYIYKLVEYIDSLQFSVNQQAETNTDKLKEELVKYGFFELPKVKQLSQPNKQILIELISTKGLPYSIAMFEYLGFLKHIKDEHFNSKYMLNKELAKWFNSDKEGRAVKGNISSLSEYSKEDKKKYTAHSHKETVKNDYQKLKLGVPPY